MKHIERRHTIRLEHPVDRVFPMFTPAGEELWIATWRPEYLHPAGRETHDGMVFRTGEGAETTLWSCVLWRPDTHHVRYVRVTPASRFGFVEVTCRAAGENATEATVAYALTSLNDDGDAMLADVTEAAFRAMIEGWRVDIERCLTEMN